MFMRSAFLALVFTLPLAAFAEGKAATGTDAVAIDQACTAEAQTAGCGAEQVGTGLLKCLGAYKKAHHDFKFSDGCKAAIQKARQDRKAKRANNS
jgi:cytochrome c2